MSSAWVLVGVTMTRFLSERFEKRSLMIVLSLLNALSMAVFYVTPADQYWLMVAVNCFGMLAAGPTPALVWSMYADTADYGEWKTGRRTTALVFSTVQFSHKMGLAVGAGNRRFAGSIDAGDHEYVACTQHLREVIEQRIVRRLVVANRFRLLLFEVDNLC